jgi:hydrogenase maturation protease
LNPRVLVYGYGNPGRLDDGLGPALARALAARGLGDALTVETGYQLQVEDAALVAEYPVVVFADADTACAEPFELRRLEPRRGAEFSTHALAPEAVLALAREHFDCETVGFVLGIRGYEWDEFREELSPAARRNLTAAADYMARALLDGSLVREAVGAEPGGAGHVRR